MSNQSPRARLAPPPATPKPSSTSRFLRLHAFELLIFVIMFILLAMCLATAPLITEEDAVQPGGKPGAPAAQPK